MLAGYLQVVVRVERPSGDTILGYPEDAFYHRIVDELRIEEVYINLGYRAATRSLRGVLNGVCSRFCCDCVWSK